MSPQAPISIDLSPQRFLGCAAGLRPFRSPSPRLQLEAFGDTLVSHNYGHGGSGITMCWGSAREAVDQLLPHLDVGQEVAVLGAGVMGLCAATLLQRKGFRPRIYTRDLPMATTSCVAGGLWAPTHVGAGATPEQALQHDRILRRTWEEFKALDASLFGVLEAPLYESDDRAYALDPMPPGLTAPPRRVAKLPFSGVGAGLVSTTLVIQTPKFLDRLERTLREAGTEFIVRTFRQPSDLAGLVEKRGINCLGLGAREACRDAQVQPIRGQLALFEPLRHAFMLDHSQGYIISRPDVLILGGTFEEGEENPQPDEATVQDIVNKHRKLFYTLET